MFFYSPDGVTSPYCLISGHKPAWFSGAFRRQMQMLVFAATVIVLNTLVFISSCKQMFILYPVHVTSILPAKLLQQSSHHCH